MSKALSFVVVVGLLVGVTGSRDVVSAQTVSVGYWEAPVVFDDEPIKMSFNGYWDLYGNGDYCWWYEWYGGCNIMAQYVSLFVFGDDGFNAFGDLFPSGYWQSAPFPWWGGYWEDYTPSEYMTETWYEVTIGVTYADEMYNGAYSIPASASFGVFPAYQMWCEGDRDKSRLIDEYHSWSLTVPPCSDVHKDGPGYPYVWWDKVANSLNDNDVYMYNHVGIVSTLLMSNLDLLLDSYNNSAEPCCLDVTSGYRSPNRNMSTAGASPTSNHMYGKAADVNVAGYLDTSHHGEPDDPSNPNPTNAYLIWLDVRDRAYGTTGYESWAVMYGAGGSSGLNHFHGDYPWLE